jgi:hypothetical protein
MALYLVRLFDHNMLFTTSDLCRWFLESARWLVLNRKSEQAVKNLKRVARINGRREEGDKINLEVRKCVLMCVYVYLHLTVKVGSLQTLRLESLKLVFQPLHKILINKL